ncbi:MAG: AAA family ATPase [Calothrix sp. MO_192.B10]|nr:AAA family ATPase [Calothrix sp. MO_192.B10]
MSISNYQHANTLKSAFQVCTLGPLEGIEIEKYYVDLSAVRKTSAVDNVSTILDFQEPADFSTILFTGHRGCGKSTELKKIQKRWQENYHVIYLEVNEETDINDASYTDLYLIVIKQVEFELRKLGLKFDQQLLRNFEDWFKDVTQETEESVEKSVSIEGEATLKQEAPFIAKLMVKLLAQIKGSHKQKNTIRQTLEKDLSRLKADINLLLDNAYIKLREKYKNKSPEYKGLLIIFDNLDRVSPAVANHLFFDYAAQLQELHCTIIYTVPISILCSPRNPLTLFDGNPHIVPMVDIYEFERDSCDLKYNQTGLDAVASLIEKRVDIDAVFASRQELLELAKASGGHVRQLMQMMRTACQTASTRKHPQITDEDVTYAVKQQQFSFERFISEEDYQYLAQVCISKDISKDDIGQLMLFNTSVLEYNGNKRWNYPNPVVKKNEFFQKALQSALAGRA